ncbi:MAG: hypothetical protein FJ100_05050 [Deltaproteobacteria bacterium]|nr:hypothetical protein [Deltaproteobacteria bacterium]
MASDRKIHSTRPAATDPRLQTLAGLPGVVELDLSRGETLMHIEHLPKGAYVFTDGGLTLTAACGCSQAVDTHSGKSLVGWFVFPSIAEMNDPAGRTAVLRRQSRAMYVPRSLFLLGDTAGALVGSWFLREVSLRAQPEPAGIHG